jgi:hypothetical protein
MSVLELELWSTRPSRPRPFRLDPVEGGEKEAVVSRQRQRDGFALAGRAEWRDTQDTRWSREARTHARAAGYLLRGL